MNTLKKKYSKNIKIYSNCTENTKLLKIELKIVNFEN